MPSGAGFVASNRRRFQPVPLNTIAGYTDEYDASNAASITSAAGAVSQWNSLSGSGHNLTQPTSARRPVTGVDTINGLNVVKFTAASSHWMSVATPDLAQPNTIYVVVKLAATSSQRQFFFSGGSTRHDLESLDSTHWGMYAGGTEVSSSSGSPDSSAHVVCGVFNGASSQMFVDGASVLTGSVGSNHCTGYTLGTFAAGGSFFLGGDIAHVVVYNAAHGVSTRGIVRATLQAKWGTS